MPSIEITQEQADALARGENVTLAPPKLTTYVVVTKLVQASGRDPYGGGVYEVVVGGPGSKVPRPGDGGIDGDITVIRPPAGMEGMGIWQPGAKRVHVGCTVEYVSEVPS